MKTAEEINQIGIEYGKQKSQYNFGITDKERSEAELDFIRGYTACQTGFASHQVSRREELKGIVKWMCDENISRFCSPDIIVDEYLKAYPEPIEPTLSQPEITDETLYKHIKNERDKLLRGTGNMSIHRMNLSEVEWLQLCLDIAKALRDGKIV